ncbi:Acireductone dioxygenase [Caenorhabditis elegans]|uniref:Acireductone dioxygenase n=1 Tax=Caenorhabditis elegans TaxID=6239 RepID=Q20340_CAEEL|nr:Acireductone dioxygenase [Caenorhabditis elegans]CAA92175.1 Acireductone dioxygenase [Caenorhabditis elegans]|eukprot:NP_510072.1 1,2-dihydroxy-3-keto-5-methylthiopentene dioxygenase [Caenorhabditis elegans]
MAYFMTDVTKENRQDECRFSPNKEATEEDLLRIGVECTKVNFDDEHVQEDLDRLIKKYDMNFHDEVHICRATMPNFDEKLDIFFEEHLHDDAELRVIKHGVGFFDVRTKDEAWIRIPVRRGDFVFLPAGIYHRFTTDPSEDVVALRLFRNNPKWTAFNRKADGDEQRVRQQYLNDISA